MIFERETILPTNDLMFKHIFWNKEYPNILISFINSILKRNDPITSIDLISTEMDDEFIGEHGIRLDLVGKTSNGEILNIVLRKQQDSLLKESKMQKKNNDDMYKRSLYYWAKLYSSQLKKGQWYKDLQPVIAINILDFDLFKDNDCNRNFVLKNEKTNEEYIRMIEMHFVELNKRKYMDQNEELYAWTEFLKAPNSEYLKSRENELKTIFNAKEIFDKAIADPIQREKIRLLEKTQMDNQSSIAKAHEDGMKKGLQKGKEAGAHEKAIETAQNLLSMGLSVEQISKATGLSIEKINKINLQK